MMRLLVLALLASCSSASSAPSSTAGSPTGAGVPSDPRLAPAEMAPILDLSSAHQAEVRDYESLFAAAATSRTAEASCAALVRAYDVASDLQLPLLDRRDALFDSPEYDALDAAIERLSKTLPGVSFAIGAEGLYAWVDHDEFNFTGDAAVKSALDAADELLANYPSWMVQQTDLGGCTRPAGATSALRHLADWDAAPACFQAALEARIAESLEAMAQSMCFCDDKAATEASLAAVSELLIRIESLEGPALAKTLAASIASPAANFECVGGA